MMKPFITREKNYELLKTLYIYSINTKYNKLHKMQDRRQHHVEAK